MASQEDYIGGTPAFSEESTPGGRAFEQTHACRLLAFDETGKAGPPPEDVMIPHGGAVTFGRNKDCTVQLTDSYVSGLHCKIWHDLKDNELWIKDYSSNGTFIDGRKIGKGNTTTLVNKNKITFSRPQLGFTVESFVDKKEEDLLADRYDFRGELGRGAFSIVKKAISVRDGRVCAIKIINKAKLLGDPKSREQVTREIEILKTVQHPNIIQYIDYVDTPTKMYIVLEFADGGELFDHIVENGAFGEEQARNIFIQLLNGVIYLHSLGIAHRDLKPENILVHREVIKITDFGLAKLSENKSFMKTLCGTPQYVAPEIIRMASQNDPEGIPGYTTAVDMWSLGVILFLLLTGRQPFTQDNGRTMSLYSQIENVDYQYPPPEDGIFVPDAAKDLITKLLQLEPANRLTATQALQHPWIASALAKQQQASSSSSHHLPETANGGQGNNKLASASLFATPSGAHAPGGNNFDHRIDTSGGITPHMPSGAGWQSMDTAASSSTPDRNEAPSRKRPFSSMDDAPPATSKPSNEGRGGAHAGAKASAFSSSAASSAAPPAPSPFAAPSSAMHPNAFQASSSSAMDTDPSETSATAGPSNANAHHGFSAQSFASPSGDPAQFMQYGSSATYIDTNIKRRKLADPNAQNQNPVHMTQ